MALLRIFLFTILVFSCQLAAGQTTFAKLYTATGYDYGRDVIESFQDSGLVVTGSSSSFTTGTADALLLKTDSLGNFEWSYVFGGSGSDWGHKVIQTQDTGYVIAGYTNSMGAGGFDFYVIKTDQYGQRLWDTTFGGSNWDIAHSLIELPNKDLVIVGETQSFGNGNKDGYIVCTDSAGHFKWEKTYGGSGDDFFKDLVYDAANDTLWITGNTSSPTKEQEGWIVNFDLDIEDTAYTMQVGGPGDDGFNATAIDNNKVYFVGQRTNQSYAKDPWIYSLISGSLHYEYTQNYNDNDALNDLAVEASSGAIHCVGYTESNGNGAVDGYKDMYFDVKLYNGGYVSYKTTFGGSGPDEGFGVVTTSDGYEVYVGDQHQFSTGGNGLVLLKIDYSDHNINETNVDIMPVTTSINDQAEVGDQFKVYPNPFSNQISIQSDFQDELKIELYHIDGRCVRKARLTPTKKTLYNLDFLSSGLYTMLIKNPKGEILKVVKLIK